jgi:tagaturonate reductase
MREYIEGCIFDEIIPTLDLPREELTKYAKSVLVRFENPYIKHYLSSIALNSVSKFKVRVLPSILEYVRRFGKMPKRLIFSFARLIEFYKHGEPNDAAEIIEIMKNLSIEQLLARRDLWGEDISFLKEAVEDAYQCDR